MAQSPYLGVNPENPDSLTDGPDHPPQYGEEVAQGELLEEADEAKVAARLRKLWTDQDLLHSRYLADVKVNEMRRQGYANVEVTKSPDRDEILITTIGQPAPGLNKAGTLCRKFVATLFSDPPEPDPQPAGADDEHEDQADLFIGALAAADEGIAATDGEGDGFDVLGARVGQRHGVADARGLEAIAGEQFTVETVEVGDGGMIGEQLGDLMERGGALGAFDIERDARRREERRNFAGHTSDRSE